MLSDKNLAIFENFKIRRHYDEKADIWYFSVIDIISALDVTGRELRKYWSDLKQKLIKEGFTFLVKSKPQTTYKAVLIMSKFYFT